MLAEKVILLTFKAGCLHEILVLRQYQLVFSYILCKSLYHVSTHVMTRHKLTFGF